MKKLLSKICLSLMGLVLSLVLFMPNFSNYANAENNSNENVVNEKYTLIGADFNKGDSLSKYNIQSSNISSFTPFNLKEGKRLSGNSFALTKGERNQILDQVVFVDSVEVPKQDNSLYIWINFDTVYLHNLKVTLELENEATLVWDLNSEILVDLVRKTEIATVLALPYSWNQLELPFNLASVTGTIYNGDKLVSAKSIKINFTSEKKQGQGSEGEDVDVEEELKITYSTLLFYDIYISKSSNTEQYSVDKQNYRFYKIIGYSEDFLNSICVGDTISLPTNFKAVVEYAWNGYDDLRNGNLNTVLWRIVVKTPNPKGEYLYPDFGSKLTFEQEGTYEIFYQCVDTKHSNSQPIISDSVKINVRALQPIYFDKTTFNMVENKTYMIRVYTSTVFDEVKNLKFTASNENVLLEYKGNGILAVTPQKTGTFSVDVSMTGYRELLNKEQSFKETFKIKVTSEKENDNRALKIFLFVSLGLFVLIFVGVLIKKIVDERKFGVK